MAIFDKLHIQDALDEVECRTLEDHMGFRGQWTEHRRFQLTFARSQGVVPESRFIEIGCGPLTLALPLISYLAPGNYVGIDVRPEVLNLGWQQIGKAGLADRNPRLLCSRSFGADELPQSSQADFIWAFSVLYHLTDELVHMCFAQVARRLAPGGSFFANINAQQDESTWLQFPFNRRDPGFYREIAARHGLKVTDLGSLESLGFELNADERLNELLKITV
jgi:SAM-dependent methyltransferase